MGKPVPRSRLRGAAKEAKAPRIATAVSIPECDSRQLEMNELSARLYIFALSHFVFPRYLDTPETSKLKLLLSLYF